MKRILKLLAFQFIKDIINKKTRTIMKTLAEFQEQLNEQRAATINIREDIERIKTQIQPGMSESDVEALYAEIATVTDNLSALAGENVSDTEEEPLPPVEPQA